MKLYDLVYIKNDSSKTEYSIEDITYDKFNNEMYSLMNRDTEEMIEDTFYPSELIIIEN